MELIFIQFLLSPLVRLSSRCFLALLKCVICWLTSSPSPPLSLLMWLSRALTYQKLNLMIIRNRLGDSIHCLGFKHIILVFCDGLHAVFKHPVGMNDHQLKIYSTTNDAISHFFVVTFLPLTKLVDVLILFMFPPPPPPAIIALELLNVDSEVSPPMFMPKPCGENMSSISEILKNGDIMLGWWVR